jgi:PAS domain S-box-containing protein
MQGDPDRGGQDLARAEAAALVDSIEETVIATDLDLIVRSWNPAAQAVYGWTEEETVGKPVRDFLLPVGGPGAAEESMRYLLEKGCWRGERIRFRKDGSTVCINETVTTLKDRDGAPIGFVGIGQDVTAYRSARDELFLKVVDEAPYPIMVHGSDGRIDLINRVWTELTGYGTADVRTVADWKRLAFAGSGPDAPLDGNEREMRTRWGTGLTWTFSALPYGSFADGRTATMLCAVDMTARRRAERARQDNADRFSALAEVSPIGIVIAREGAVLYCNGAAERLLGLPPRLSSGLLIAEWLETLPKEAADALAPVLASGARRAGPFPVDGESSRWVEAIAKLVEAAAGDMEMITLLDATDRVLADERERSRRETLIQTEKLASLGILVAGVAHEINNPNYTISINADIIADAWRSVSPIIERELAGRPADLVGGMEWSEARAQIPLLLSGIAAASRDIESIVKGLKDFSRADENPVPEEVSVNQVVKASLALLSNYVKKSTRSLSLSLAEDLPPARAHFQRLEQVVVNLVQNSCQALTDPEQAVRLSTSYDPESGLVRIVVEDEGRGMKPEELARVKVPFYTTKQSIGGVGLGVSISDSIVAEFGGRLDYESAPGAGTRATVSLRAAVAEGSAP